MIICLDCVYCHSVKLDVEIARRQKNLVQCCVSMRIAINGLPDVCAWKLYLDL